MKNDCVCDFFASSCEGRLCVCVRFDPTKDQELYEACEDYENLLNFDPAYDEELVELCVVAESCVSSEYNQELESSNQVEDTNSRRKRRFSDEFDQHFTKIQVCKKSTDEESSKADVETDYNQYEDIESQDIQDIDFNTDYIQNDDSHNCSDRKSVRNNKYIQNAEGDSLITGGYVESEYSPNAEISNNIHNVDELCDYVQRLYDGKAFTQTNHETDYKQAENETNYAQNEESETDYIQNEFKDYDSEKFFSKLEIKGKPKLDTFTINMNQKLTTEGIAFRITAASDNRSSEPEDFFSYIQKHVRNKLADILQQNKSIRVDFSLHGKCRKGSGFIICDTVRVTTLENRDARFQVARNTILKKYEVFNKEHRENKSLSHLNVEIY